MRLTYNQQMMEEALLELKKEGFFDYLKEPEPERETVPGSPARRT